MGDAIALHGSTLNTEAVMLSRTLVSLALLAAVPLAAQKPNPFAAADSALSRCLAAGEREDEKVAKAEADRAEKLYKSLESASATAADALVGQARVIGQCRIPFVSFMRKG